MWRRIGVAVSCAPASIGVPGAATINRPSRVTVNSPTSSWPRVAAEQRDGAGAGEIDAAPLKAGAQRSARFRSSRSEFA